MKVGTDGVLLGAWAPGAHSILDIGSGTGVVALMMAQRYDDSLVTAVEMDEETSEGFGLLSLHMVHRAHGEAVLLCQISLDEEEDQCDQDCDDRYGSCEVVVGSHLSDILVVDDDGECGVALSYHQRGSEICDSSHEDHQCGGQD